jgi:hypothetical protein
MISEASVLSFYHKAARTRRIHEGYFFVYPDLRVASWLNRGKLSFFDPFSCL